MFTERQFLNNQRKHNGLFSLTMVGAAPTPTWTQPSYHSMLQLHGRAYHRIMDAFRGQYDEPTPVVNKARMYIYNAEMMKQARSMDGLNMATVATLLAALATHNSWVRQYKSILLDLNSSVESNDNFGIEFAQVTRQTQGSVIGDAPRPTGKEIAALIFKDGPETRAQRFVYTFPRAGPDSLCHRPRFVPLWSPAYESLQYSLLFFNGESGWSPGSYKEIPFKNSRTLSITNDKLIKIFFTRGNGLCAQKFSKNYLSPLPSFPINPNHLHISYKVPLRDVDEGVAQAPKGKQRTFDEHYIMAVCILPLYWSEL